MSTIVIDAEGRPEPPESAGEVATLIGFLEFQRATLEWKTRGLAGDDLARTVAASSMTLGGLLKHLAFVEDHWSSYMLHDRPRSAPWSDVDWAADPDWEWRTSAADDPEALRRGWMDAVTASRASLDEALAAGGLDRTARRARPDGSAPTLRWILVHMIEEYARHNGHADLLREAIDGQVGE